METKVQIFQIDEVTDLSVPEVTEQWKALVADLGLKGQTKLLSKETEEVVSSPVPYVWMNKRLVNVITCLCPMKENIEKYAKTPIPLELLGHIKQAEMKGWFEKVEVWYDDKDPDPVLVGTARKDTYLIGRWGAENVTLSQLDEMATTRMKKECITKAKNKIGECEQAIAQIDQNVQKQLDGEYNPFTYGI
jgi:hypothetical protein